MRILVVVHAFPPRAQGGSEIYAHTHACALHRLFGDEVLVLTREADPASVEYRVRTEHRDGLTVAWVNNTFQRARNFEETYRNPAIDAIAAGLIDDFRPDVAHVHHLTCLSTGIVESLARRGIPCVLTLHDYWLICHRGQLLDREYHVCDGPEPSGCDRCLGPAAGLGGGAYAAAATVRSIERRLPPSSAQLFRRAARQLARVRSSGGQVDLEAGKRFDHMRSVCRDVTWFLAPSRQMRARFVQFGVPSDRIGLSDYGFDHRLFFQSTRPASRPLRLGFLGTMMVSKAPDLLLEAFSRLPPDSATVDLFGAYSPYHGDDAYRQRLEPLLALSGVRVHGTLPHDGVPAALASIDVLVVPSIWPENSPLVIREAFLAGIPVIGSRIGGIPEAIEEGRGGLLFRAGDSADLQRTIERLLGEPALLETLRAGIPAVRTIEDDVASARDLYGKLLRDRSISHDSTGPTQPDTRPGTKSVAAIVLNYRTPDDTLLAVKSLLASRRPIDSVIVVNNDATESPCATLTALAPSVSYLHTGRNLGFSGGMNAGIRAALARGAERVLLVNSDVIVPPDCVGRLEDALETSAQAGIAAPILLARSDPGQVASLGISWAPRSGRMYHRGFGTRTNGVHLPASTAVDGVSGCLMLIRREIFDSVGLFDEDYFFAFEDLDFCLRAGRAGFRSVVVGTAKAYHEGGRSIGAGSPRRLYFAARNHLLLARRRNPSGPLLSVYRTSSIVALNLAYAVFSTGGSLTERLRAVMKGTRDYARGRLGPD